MLKHAAPVGRAKHRPVSSAGAGQAAPAERVVGANRSSR